jgi:hypothetical protein
MTMPTNVPATESALPEPEYPMVTLVISNPVFPREPKHQQAACPHCKGAITLPVGDKEDPKPVAWLIGKPHPFVPTAKIVRMHVIEGVVTVFSLSEDASACIIDELPIESVRLIEKGMPYEVFVEELEDAEGEDDPEPDPEPKLEPNGTQATTAAPNSVS